MHNAFCMIILLIELQRSILINFINIPFYKKNFPLYEDGHPERFIDFLHKDYIYIEIEVGTPYQKLKINPRTDLYLSYIVNEDSYFNNIKYKPYDLIEFKASKSSSYIMENKLPLNSWMFTDAFLIKEQVKIGNLSISNLTLIQGVNFKSSVQLSSDSGILGLGINYRVENETKRSNIISNLINKSIIDSYNFFIDYTSENEGNIILGATPNEYNSKIFDNNFIAYAKIPQTVDSMNYGFYIDDIFYGDEKINIYNREAKLTLQYGFIGVDIKTSKILYKDFFFDMIEKGICKEYKYASLSKVIYCNKNELNKDKLKNLRIYNNQFNKTFTFDLKNLWLDYGNKSIFLIEFIQYNFFIFGEPFLKQNIFIFNQDTKQLGLYNKNNNENKNKNKEIKIKQGSIQKSFYVFIFLPLSIIIIFSLILSNRKSKKKINKNNVETELLDNYSS